MKIKTIKSEDTVICFHNE